MSVWKSSAKTLGIFVLGALGALGCGGNDFDTASEVLGVRVLAVRPQGPLDPAGNAPASGFPGETLTLEMLYTDGRAELPEPGATPEPPAPGEPPEPPPPMVAWLGGCHNPQSRLYYGCAPTLRAIAENTGELPPGSFGLGSPFELPIPDDILTSASRIETDPIHFGVSYVFFGVCAGNIKPRPGPGDGIPLVCEDASGAALGPRDFVVGFSTLYTYEGVRNLNPSLPSVHFDGNAVVGVDCIGPDSCLPTVPVCPEGADCPEHRIAPDVDDASFERLPDGANEILWANYYATRGQIVKESQLVADRTSGRVSDFTSSWRAPATGGIVRLWVTINDERAGAVWASFDVRVE